MAFRAFLFAIFIAVAVAPTLATDYKVGDDAGWKLGINYTMWAAGKYFRVGDMLTFTYKVGSHNVLKVNGTDFKQCASSNATQAPLTSGNDTIQLISPGKKWYICGVNDHCSKGMKLVITVSAAEGPAPSPMPGTSNPPAGTSDPPPGTSNPPAGTSDPPPGTSDPPPGTSNPPAGTSDPPPGTSDPPPGTSAAGGVSPVKSCMWILAVIAVYRMIMA